MQLRIFVNIVFNCVFLTSGDQDMKVRMWVCSIKKYLCSFEKQQFSDGLKCDYNLPGSSKNGSIELKFKKKTGNFQ